MASLHLAVDQVISIKRPSDTVLAPALSLVSSMVAKLASLLCPRDSKEEIKQALERAASDSRFLAQLTDQGSKALQGYRLSREEQAALISGDINWVEAHVGKLDARSRTWFQCRLQQESW